MGIKRICVAVCALSILAACATSPRPVASDSPTDRAVVSPPVATEVKASPQPAPVPQPAEAVAPAPQVAPPPVPVEVEKPIAAEVAKPAEAARAPKIVKEVQPPVAAKPKPPKPVVASSPAAEVMDASVIAAEAKVEGKLELVAGSGQSLDADELGQAMVYFLPDQAAKAKPGRFLIYTHNKQFEPASMVIPLGSTISFPNQDEILHNVFSVTPQSSFDLGIYGEGKSAEYTFKKPGLVLINCNVHQGMQANVLVVNTPFIAAVDKQGRFSLGNVPSGRGKLMVWHPRANAQELAVTLPLAAPVSLQLVLTKPRVVDHLNKERKSY